MSHGQPGLLSAPNAAQFVCLSALVVQSWDFITHVADEVEYLWRGRFTFVKALYFSARYIMLGVQIADQSLAFTFDLLPHRRPQFCPRIFALKSVLCQAVLTIVEIILLLRVTASHYRIKWNGLVVRSLLGGVGCIPPKLSKTGIGLFIVGAAITQAVIISSTVINFRARGREGWSRSPLGSLVLREGVTIFFLVIVLILTSTAFEVAQDHVSTVVRDAGFSWYLALFSVAGSRLILNMRKLPTGTQGAQRDPRMGGMSSDNGEQSNLEDSIYLTTFFSE
ncbi:hypothetical protein D9613_011757 [Agrocybe pediades]|uniref:DUF6533 domain-containing protein n=1 Tax=Agrocybe pediades TaxID=84607 RepID=A0A8H4QKS0_9AGAR|nr:hypothetical protein D9613_011757 [Agrocybe pediades]